MDDGLACLCLVTTSHTESSQRFRLLFPLSKTITSEEIFLASMEKLAERFPESDKSCLTDTARAYFGCKLDDGYWVEGKLFDPVEPPKTAKNDLKSYYKDSLKAVNVDLDLEEIVEELYGQKRAMIPEAIDYFIKNAHTGLDGHWTVSLNRAVFVLSLQGIEDEVILDLVEYLAPDKLDKTDMNTIKYALRDGKKHRLENN